MTDRINLATWLAQQDQGKFDSKDNATQVNAGWIDWFCQGRSLAGRLAKLVPWVRRIAYSTKIDTIKTYVVFENNCPNVGNLYDEFRICDIETHDVLYIIVPKSGHRVNRGESEVWGRENDFDRALVTGTRQDVFEFFGV